MIDQQFATLLQTVAAEGGEPLGDLCMIEVVIARCERYQQRLADHVNLAIGFAALLDDPEAKLLTRKKIEYREIVAATFENAAAERRQHLQYLRRICGPGNQP